MEKQNAPLARSQLRHFYRRIRRLHPMSSALQPAMQQAVVNLSENRRRSNHAAYRQKGFPFGRGTVESAARTLVQQRMKQDGMR
ncbi:MAG: hypothetical protein OXI52_12125 [Caldilineaceae bacterium]|nr:hypothetical protein [Caldilineaceae bacterium]